MTISCSNFAVLSSSWHPVHHNISGNDFLYGKGVISSDGPTEDYHLTSLSFGLTTRSFTALAAFFSEQSMKPHCMLPAQHETADSRQI